MGRWRVKFGAALFLGTGAFLYFIGPRWQQDTDENWFATSEGRPRIIAHRGGKGIFPENTMVAFEGAVGLGVDILELDVNLSSDAVPVVIHGPNMEITTEKEGPISDYSFAEIQQLDAAYRFRDPQGENPWLGRGVRHPHLRDLLMRFRAMPQVRFLIEIKDHGERAELAANAVAEVLRETGMHDRVMVGSFYLESLDAFRKASLGEVLTSSSQSEVQRLVVQRYLLLDRWWADPGPIAAMQVPTEAGGLTLADDGLVQWAQSHRQAVHFWTINDPKTMGELVDIGADGIITDRPDLLRELLAERGYSLPSPQDLPK